MHLLKILPGFPFWVKAIVCNFIKHLIKICSKMYLCILFYNNNNFFYFNVRGIHRIKSAVSYFTVWDLSLIWTDACNSPIPLSTCTDIFTYFDWLDLVHRLFGSLLAVLCRHLSHLHCVREVTHLHFLLSRIVYSPHIILSINLTSQNKLKCLGGL